MPKVWKPLVRWPVLGHPENDLGMTAVAADWHSRSLLGNLTGDLYAGTWCGVRHS
jgi:hypothetical protein